jgi:photosystem II stability/assembly factor-like uncharacterized protein
MTIRIRHIPPRRRPHIAGLALVVASSLMPAHAAGQWTWQSNPPPILREVFFLNHQKGWALGALGTVSRTTDGGATWTSRQAASITDLANDIFFVDDSVGWISGSDGILFKSIDGGANWSGQNTGITDGTARAYFINRDTGWVAGGTLVRRSLDGGATWTTVLSGGTAVGGLHFRKNGRGWVRRSGAIRRSTDFGATWPVSVTMAGAGRIDFANDDTGWASGPSGALFKTTDGGLAWTAQASGTTDAILDLRALGPNKAAALDYNGNFLRTTNGSTWTKTAGPSNANVRESAHVLSEDTGWAVDEVGYIFRTTDGGLTWPAAGDGRFGLGNLQGLHAVHFVDTSRGWACGERGVIVRTTNGGATWTLQASGGTAFLNDIQFSGPDTGWVAGASGLILKTTNGGATWSALTTPTTQYLYGLHFRDHLAGWAVGEAGTVLRTTNGGTSWTQQTQGSEALYALQFVDANRGWITGHNGAIYRTTNGGTSWAKQTSGTTTFLRGLHFTDTLNGWAAGGSNLLRTTNGGSSWSLGTAGNFRTVHFTDDHNGWAVGTPTVRTTDGGKTWQQQSTLPASPVPGFAYINPGGDVYFRDLNHGWIAGYNGSLMKFTGDAPPSPPTPLSPAAGAQNQAASLILSWRVSSSATAYRVQLAADSAFAAPLVDDSSVTVTSRTTGALQPGTTYYWRLSARNGFGFGNWGVEQSFSTLPLVPSPPALVSPAAGATGVSAGGTSLVWNASAGAATYRVQLSTDSLFATTALNDSTVAATTRSADALLNNTAYYWRVNAKNISGTSAYSETRKFITAGLEAPALAAPADNATQFGTNVNNLGINATVSWNAVSNAATYRLQMSTDSTFAGSLWTDDSTLTTLSSQVGPGYLTLYFWRVNARNAGGTSAWSSVRRFTTVAQDPYSAPTLSSPANNATQVALSPSLSWAGYAGIAYQRLQVSTDSLFSTLAVHDTSYANSPRQIGPLASGTRYFWRVNARNTGGTSPWSEVRRFTTAGTIAVLPADFTFNRSGLNGRIFQFGLPRRARVKVTLFDARGNTVRTLMDAEKEAGYHALPLSSPEVAEGAYYLLDFRAGSFHKMFNVLP